MIAKEIGAERAEEELFPQIVTQVHTQQTHAHSHTHTTCTVRSQTQHKDAERRWFAARGIASVAACVRPRQRAVLALPALAQH